MLIRIKWALLGIAFWLAIVAAGNLGLRRTEEASALTCARASDGTDSAIVQCYVDRNLPIPKDL